MASELDECQPSLSEDHGALGSPAGPCRELGELREALRRSGARGVFLLSHSTRSTHPHGKGITPTL